ncbi:MAG: FtsX-like permease family protein, partial [Anaerolineae bacterium]
RSQCQVEVGDHIGPWVDSQPVEFEVVGTVDYFPTMYEEQSAGYIVTSLGALTQELNQLVPDSVHANELFVALQPGQQLGEQFGDVLGSASMQAETVRKAIKADPLALGLRSVTLFGYLLTAVLSLAGFGTHFYLTTRQHSRTYVVLRALGLSPRQLYGMLLLEQVVLIVSGLALGTGLGLLVNRVTLPGLPLSLGGRPPVPPFLAETNWRAVGGIYLSLAVAFLASLALATVALWRVKLHRQLRVDEE